MNKIKNNNKTRVSFTIKKKKKTVNSFNSSFYRSSEKLEKLISPRCDNNNNRVGGREIYNPTGCVILMLRSMCPTV